MSDSKKEELIIEDAFNRLGEITSLMEKPDIGLKESLDLYSEGVKLVAACKENLEGVEKEIQILNEV